MYAALVLIVGASEGRLLTLQCYLVAFVAYWFIWSVQWLWSFAPRTIALYSNRILIGTGRFPREIILADLARVEGKSTRWGLAIRLVVRPGGDTTIFLRDGLSLDTAAGYFRERSVEWSDANHSTEPAPPSRGGSS